MKRKWPRSAIANNMECPHIRISAVFLLLDPEDAQDFPYQILRSDVNWVLNMARHAIVQLHSRPHDTCWRTAARLVGLRFFPWLADPICLLNVHYASIPC